MLVPRPQPCPMEKKGMQEVRHPEGPKQGKATELPATRAPIPIQVAGRSIPDGSSPLGDPWVQTPLTPAYLEDRN